MEKKLKNNAIIAFLPNTLGNSFIIVLDELQKQINKGEKLILIGCEGSINHCELNLFGFKYICSACAHCLKKATNYLDGDFEYFSLKYFLDKTKKRQKRAISNKIRNIKDLKNLKYKDFEVGYALASTYISSTRNHNPIFDKKLIKFINYLYNDSLYIYDAVEVILEKLQPKKILVYNGRLHTSRPVFSLAQSKGISIDVLEVVGGYGGRSIERVIYKNALPHNIANNTKLINENWNLFSNEKFSISKSFYENRKIGIEAGDKAYVTKQSLGQLPENFNNHKQNISIFISSDDEMAAIGKEWEWDFFGGTQFSAINKILELFSGNTNIHFYVRIHPNLKNIKFRYHTDYFSLENKFKNVTVISAKSKISTYSLIEYSNKIISFGSTVGAEATYWRKPSILIGKSLYMNLEITYNAQSEKELISFIMDDNLVPKPIEGALKYGLYLYERKGEKLKYFSPNKHIQRPKWLNQNLYLYNLDPKKKYNFSIVNNFILFSTSRFVNNFLLRSRIPKKEK